MKDPEKSVSPTLATDAAHQEAGAGFSKPSSHVPSMGSFPLTSEDSGAYPLPNFVNKKTKVT